MSDTKISNPAPNWCRTCGRRPNDPMAALCLDTHHLPLERLHPQPAELAEQQGVDAVDDQLLDELRDVEDYFNDVEPNPIHLATVQAAISALAVRQPGTQEAVAVVGPNFSICWVGSGPIAPLVQRHNLKRGSLLYAAPPAQGIDLGPLRELLNSAALFHDKGFEGRCRSKIDSALALIDQRDAAPGVGS